MGTWAAAIDERRRMHSNGSRVTVRIMRKTGANQRVAVKDCRRQADNEGLNQELGVSGYDTQKLGNNIDSISLARRPGGQKGVLVRNAGGWQGTWGVGYGTTTGALAQLELIFSSSRITGGGI